MANGSNCLNTKEEVLSTSEMEEQWMLSKTKKDKELNSKTEMERPNNCGRLYILTRRKQKLLRDFIQTLVFTATDHSTLFQDYQ